MRINIGIAVVSIALCSACTGGSGDRESAPTTRPPTSASASAPALTKRQATVISADLSSGSLMRLRRAVAAATDAPITADAAARFAALGPIVFDVATFQRTGADTATVLARARGRSYRVDLVEAGSRWLVAATETVAR